MNSGTSNRRGVTLIGLALLFSTISCSIFSSAQKELSDVELTEIARSVQQTQTANAAQAAAAQPTPQPTYTFLPTYTIDPAPVDNPTETTEAEPASPAAPSETPSGQFSMQVEKNTNAFYCKSDPKKVTFTLKVSHINLGFALYYHFEDPKTGKVSPNIKADIHRDSTETYRTITLVGDPALGSDYYSVVVSLPAGMGPSKLVYEIIADDNSYRTNQMDDVMFYPCSYTKP